MDENEIKVNQSNETLQECNEISNDIAAESTELQAEGVHESVTLESAAAGSAAPDSTTFDSTAPGNTEPVRAQDTSSANGSRPVYYTENYKKQKPKKTSVLQLVIVAVLSAVLGGGVVAAAFVFVAPLVQPSIAGYLGSNVQTSGITATNNGAYKR